MPKGLGSFGPSFASTTLAPAALSATFTGLAQGIQNSSLKSTEIIDKCKKADNLLKSIQESIRAFDSEFRDVDKQFSGLDIYRESLNADDLELFPAVDFTRQEVAMIPELVSQGIGSVSSHAVQTVSDSVIASKVVSSGPSIRPLEEVTQPSKLQENARDNFFACCKHFMKNIGPLTDQLHQKVKDKFIAGDHAGLQSHEISAMAMADVSFSASVASPSVVASLLWDTVGSFLRNCQETIISTQQSDIREAKVIEAMGQCLKSMNTEKLSKESCLESLDNLNHLIDALSDMNASNKRMSEDLVTDSEPLLKLSSLATIPFIATLKLTVNSALGCILASEAVENKLESIQSKQLITQASSLEKKGQDQQRSSSHSKNILSLTQRFKNINQALREAVDADQKLQGSSDASSVLGVGIASTLTSATLSLLPLLLIELGSVTQEIAAGIRFSDGSSDKIVTQCDIVTQSDNNIGEELDNLFKEALKTQDALDMAKELGNSSPIGIGLTRASACGAAASTLAVIFGAYSACKQMQTTPKTLTNSPGHSELKNEEIKQVADSVIEIKKSHHKASSVLSTSAPKNMTAENALESVLNKVILAGRISQSDVGDLKDRKDLNSVGKASIAAENCTASGLTRASEFLTGALSAVTFVALESSISTEALLRACGNTVIDLAHACARIKEASEGPDKSTLTGSNLSFLSNALRLLAASKSEEMPGSQQSVFSTVSVSEAIASRSLTVFLSQSNVISDALANLIRPHEVADEKSKSRMKTKASAREEVLAALADVIEDRLNRENKAIPGLNKDMASQLQPLTRQRIISALTAEMTLIEPFFVLGDMLAEGSHGDVPPRHDQEALINSSPSKQASILSNMIQGFTLASIRAADYFDALPDQNQPLLRSHQKSRNSDKSTFKSTGYLCLSLVESIGSIIGRAFTLLDREEISNASDKISQHAQDELIGNLKLSTAEVKADSHLGQPISAISSISALKSTLTHLSAALKECADELAAEVNKTAGDDFVKGVEMHTIQTILMRSMAQALSTCASLITRALATGSGLSFSHIIALGKVDKQIELNHSHDESLELHQNNSSQRSSRESESDLSVVTGLSTDLVMSSVTNLTKILLSASLLGSDVLLSVAKVLEILILDVNPAERLKHETQALCVPDIRTAGFSKALKQASISTEMVPTISTGQLCVSHDDPCLRSTLEDSFISLQARVNKLIDQMQVLEDSADSDNDAKGDKENKKDIRQYISQVLKTLESRLSDQECTSLIDRFDKGGIALSSYHSHFGGILNFSEEKEDRILTSAFDRHSKIRNIYNTKALIEKFINDMFVEYSNFLKQTDDSMEDPLKKFNQTLGSTLTSKAQNLHEYIICGIANKLYEANNLIRATFWHGPRTSFNRDGFLARYSNLRATLNIPKVTEAKEESEIEFNLSQVEEARRKRAEKRAKPQLELEKEKKDEEVKPVAGSDIQSTPAQEGVTSISASKEAPSESTFDGAEKMSESLRPSM